MIFGDTCDPVIYWKVYDNILCFHGLNLFGLQLSGQSSCVDTQSRCYQTARLVEMMDKLFDCLNVTSFTTGKHARKEFQDPWRPNDFRFKVRIVVNSDIVLVI